MISNRQSKLEQLMNY